MSETDPRRLMPMLGDLAHDLARALETYRAVCDVAENGHRTVNEHSWRLKTLAEQLADTVWREEVAAGRPAQDVSRVTQRATDARWSAETALANARGVAAEADSRFHDWREKLSYTRPQYESAKTELELARRAEQEAINLERDARVRLAQAEDALGRCERGPRAVVDAEHGISIPPDCSSENGRVINLKVELEFAVARRVRAEERGATAEVELARADAELRRAEAGVALSGQAADAAHSAVEKGQQSHADAERAVEISHAAERLVELVRRRLREAKAASDQVRASAERMRQQVDAAAVLLAAARHHSDRARHDGLRARRDLDYRVEQLRLLNLGPRFS